MEKQRTHTRWANDTILNNALRKEKLERDVELEILIWLNTIGIKAWKVKKMGVWDGKKGIYRKSNAPYDINGQADISGILPNGQRLEIEVKKPKVNPRNQEQLRKLGSDDQRAFIDMIRENNGIAFFTDSLEYTKECLSDVIPR